MKSSIALERELEIVSSDLIADNTLIQVIKDKEIEKVRVLWIEQRDKENVVCDYEFGPFKVIAQTYDEENDTVVLYSNDNQIIEYNDKIFGVQFHPENESINNCIFKYIISKC